MLAVAEERAWFRRTSYLDFPCAIANQLAEVWGDRGFSKRQFLQLKK